MSRDVTEHLRDWARLSVDACRERNSLDYSDSAITARLREASALLTLCLRLGARIEHDDSDREPCDPGHVEGDGPLP